MRRKLTKKDFKVSLILSAITSVILFSSYFLIDELKQSQTFVAILVFNTIISIVISIAEYRELYN